MDRERKQPDTCLVRYTIENRDQAAHKVGLRFLLDTFVGSHDGVPFAVPGVSALCDTSCDHKGADVPDFLEALETDDLKNPGVVAHLGLRLGTGLETPGRVVVGAWPDAKLQKTEPLAQGNLTRWDVPLLSLKQQADSAVTLYWPEEDLGPDARRELGFTYGLGPLAGAEGQGRLALSVGGTFTPGNDLTVAAYVKEPAKGEKLTLELPVGWKLVQGPAVAAVALPPAAASRHISLVATISSAGCVIGPLP